MGEQVGNARVRGPQEAVAKGSVVLIKTLIDHPMESGLRKDKESGETIPAHHVTDVVVNYAGKEVMKAVWTGAVSKNPFFAFSLKATTSGPVKVTWKDNKGVEFSGTAEVKVS
ncbi:MAG: thiosulfate oxidation carrier complex protein SoxZ [Magnetococcales bacterium]|nr:thiosulfate oxidation carrier complex protein SoxZ [Magnetococcales bacterium]MBF0156677.1 thiosulfate oxidation carrier complex protein SoxZ [Magnetococcales bacterium]